MPDQPQLIDFPAKPAEHVEHAAAQLRSAAEQAQEANLLLDQARANYIGALEQFYLDNKPADHNDEGDAS